MDSNRKLINSATGNNFMQMESGEVESTLTRSAQIGYESDLLNREF
jgi:hypothetical protein